MSKDSLKPKKVVDCHFRIDDLLHTNKTQAEHIAILQSRLHASDLATAKLNAQLTIMTVKFNNLLGDWKALKGMLGMLAADEVLDFMPRVEPLDSKSEKR
jgi:uncharacterized coiled-coil protein SlyX